MTNKDIENMKNMIDELAKIAKDKENENAVLKQQVKTQREKIDSLLKELEEEKDFQDMKTTVYKGDINRDALIAKLQDQHQQDCILINDLTTTVHVLAGLYSALRKNVGMD